MNRKVAFHVPAYKINMGGILLDQALPSETGQDLDPFLLLHYARGHYPEGGHPRDYGVGPHPHRGFSPVTFVLKGAVYHQDSRGNKQIVEAGGVQWMDSARGIIHSERPPKALLEMGGEFEMIQLWINSPSQSKMDQPNYQPLPSGDIPVVGERAAQIKVIAGQYKETVGKIVSKSPLDVFMLDLERDAVIKLPQKQEYNTALFIIEGGVKIDQHAYFTKDLVAFAKEGDSLEMTATAPAKILYVSGLPLNEKVVKQGPFVMNSQTEVMEAMRDYQMGKMGVLIEEYI